MVTYQDLLEVEERDEARMDFVRRVIADHKTSDLYQNAQIAYEYDKKKNVTIMEYRKLLYTITGEVVPDNYSANYKIVSSFFNRFVLQENQYLLGNGITWQEDDTTEKLGDKFDYKLQKLGHDALVGGVSFGFWNFDHLENFNVLEFAPLYDEEDGAMKAGVRFWQMEGGRPLRATLYELDGYTDYIWRPEEEGAVLHEKRGYIAKIKSTPADGDIIYDYENYPEFPIVPLWGNPQKQSELVGLREGIDAYDLIKSGFANDIDDTSLIYWTINNAGGMDDVDLRDFIQHMKTVKAAVVDDDGARAEAHTMDVPYGSREALLERLRIDLYEDAMALDVRSIAGGAVTATQIKAAYELLNNKADMYEYCVLDFLEGILRLADIDDEPTFTRSIVVNTQEGIQNVLQAAQYLDTHYVTEKLLNLLGDGDRAEEMIKRLEAQEAEMQMGLLEEENEDGLGLEEEDDDIDSQLNTLLTELGE